MKAQTDKLQEMFNKELGNTNNKTEMNNIVTAIKKKYTRRY